MYSLNEATEIRNPSPCWLWAPGNQSRIKKENSNLLYRRDVCWNDFQMDLGGSGREVTEELCVRFTGRALLSHKRLTLEESAPALSM